MENQDKKIKKIWDEVVLSLASDKNIDPEIFNNYISKGVFKEVSTNNIIIEVSSEIAKTIFFRFKKKIEVLINEKTNPKDKKQYFVDFLTNKDLKLFKTKETKNEYNQDQKVGLYQNKSFENFIKGESNEEAYSASLSVAKEPGSNWNPLFIYGSPGLGKTHLLYSIRNKINLIDKSKIVWILNSEDLGREIVEIIRKGHDAIEDYKKDLKKPDVLLIDDIQLLAHRDKTNEIIFSIFNFFIKWKKQIVITSDCNPAELVGFQNRLVSRFNSGLSLMIKKPEFETTVQIIVRKLKSKKVNIELEPQSIDFIASNFSYDIRLIEGIINRIIFWSIINDKKGVITRKEVVEILKSLKTGYNRKITNHKIIDSVSRWYKISIDQMKSNDRTRVVVNARRIFIYLSRKLLNEPYKKIGTYLNKDHSTMIFAYRVIAKKIDSDDFLKQQINKIITKLK